MSPPTEQLIRDYVSRLSVAAQGRLSRDDRRALLDRTRGYIEHNTGLSGPATALEVAAVLYRLGDPVLVVAHEVQRLAEIRGDDGEPPQPRRLRLLPRVGRREPGRLSASWHWPARPGNLDDLHAVLTGGRAGAAGSSAARPGEPDTDGDVAGRVAGERDEAAETAGTLTTDPRTSDMQTAGTWASDAEIVGMQTAGAQTVGRDTQPPVSGLEALGLIGSRQDGAGGATRAPSDAGQGGLTPVGPGSLAGMIPAQGRFGGAGRSAGAGPQRPSWPHGPAIRRDAAETRQDAEDEAAVAPEDQAAVEKAEADGLAVVTDPGSAGEVVEGLVVGYADQGVAGEVVASAGPSTGDLTAAEVTAADPAAVDAETGEVARFPRMRRVSAAVVGWTRDKTLESVATILLGLGGVIFPPIWLLGAMVALASKVWDYRDKWLGLAIPIVLTIVGAAAGMILAGSQTSFGHDLHVGWVSADIASRISAALSAIYLAWRSVHGRRPDAVPPWNKPYRVG